MELSQRLDLGGLQLEEETPADTFARLAGLVEEVTGVVVKQSSRIDDTVLTDHPTAGELADYLEEHE